jgi:hypothetical protein
VVESSERQTEQEDEMIEADELPELTEGAVVMVFEDNGNVHVIAPKDRAQDPIKLLNESLAFRRAMCAAELCDPKLPRGELLLAGLRAFANLRLAKHEMGEPSETVH